MKGSGAWIFPAGAKREVTGEVRGLFDGRHHFSDGEVDLAETIAHHIAFALERKRHEEELREAFEETRGPTRSWKKKLRELQGFEEVQLDGN